MMKKYIEEEREKKDKGITLPLSSQSGGHQILLYKDDSTRVNTRQN
jgi:hypothetical protein